MPQKKMQTAHSQCCSTDMANPTELLTQENGGGGNNNITSTPEGNNNLHLGLVQNIMATQQA